MEPELDPETEAFLEENDLELVDDYYVINGADRAVDGRFCQVPSRKFRTDGRRPIEPDLFRLRAEEIAVSASAIGTLPLRQALAAVRDMRLDVDDLEFELVAQVRGAGWSWQEVGDALGLTRSAAHKRFAQDDVSRQPRGPKRVTTPS